MTVFMHAVGFGLVTAGILALSAVALSLQYGVTNVPNFAHGDFLTIAAYAALVCQAVITKNLIVDTLIAGLVVAACAWLMNRAVLTPFGETTNKITLLFIVTIGVSLIIENAISAYWGDSTQALALPRQQLHDIGPFQWTTLQIAIMIVALLCMAAVHVVLRYTRFGKAQRAVADDVSLARISGINTPRIIALTWLLSGFLAGISGVALVVDTGSFIPTFGFVFLLPTFSAAVVGGIGRPYGAMIGAVLLGMVTELAAPYIAGAYKQVIALAVLGVVLLIRPTGLFRATGGAGVGE